MSEEAKPADFFKKDWTAVPTKDFACEVARRFLAMVSLARAKYPGDGELMNELDNVTLMLGGLTGKVFADAGRWEQQHNDLARLLAEVNSSKSKNKKEPL